MPTMGPVPDLLTPGECDVEWDDVEVLYNTV